MTKKKARKPGPRKHLVSDYTNRNCRCDRCKKAHRIKQAVKRAQLAQTDTATWNHGRNRTYINYKCRCEPCKAAHKVLLDSWRARQQGRV